MNSNTPDVNAFVEIINLDIINANDDDSKRIKINLELKFSLNCTNVNQGDILCIRKFSKKLKKQNFYKLPKLKKIISYLLKLFLIIKTK